MLADERRNDAYQAAIEKVVSAEDRVLDIGTGSGLLAMMAARAGATSVYACEMQPLLADTARRVIRDNKYDNTITILTKKSTDMRVGEGADMPERASVLVSEILDVGLLGEGMLPTVRHAVQHLLTEDARLIPARAGVYGKLVAIPQRRRSNPVKTVSGFDLSAFDRFRIPGEYIGVNLQHEEHESLSEPFELLQLDFRALPPVATFDYPNRRRLDVSVTADGELHALVFWFDLHLDDDIRVSSRPGGELLHWGQAAFFFEGERTVQAGETLAVNVMHNETQIWFSLA